MLTVLVVGTGWVARKVHLPYLVRSDLVDRILVMDSDVESPRSAARDFDASVHTGSISSAGADLAVICTPPSAHASYVLDALDCGMRVICEKPLALSSADALAISQTVQSKGTKVDVCYTNRFHPAVRCLRDVVLGGLIGTINRMDLQWIRRSGIPGSSGAREAGVLWDLGSHLINLAIFVTDWSDAGLAWAKELRLGGSRDQAVWYSGPDEAIAPPLVDTVVGHLMLRDRRSVTFRASWACGIQLDEVAVNCHGATGTLSLRTLFGFSPDRLRIASPALVITMKGSDDSVTVLSEQERHPFEYQIQLDSFLVDGADRDGFEMQFIRR